MLHGYGARGALHGALHGGVWSIAWWGMEHCMVGYGALHGGALHGGMEHCMLHV